MSGFTFRPAKRENTPLIVGLAGPTKSGKTFSALRLAMGLANGGVIAMLNAEGKRGEQYADNFSYVNCNIDAPYSPERFTEALMAMKALKPAVGIIDSASHMHDGPGGLLEYHSAELDRMAGADFQKRDKCNFTAWIKPKAAENKFIYTMLAMDCPIILCFRAKEKLKIVAGKQPVDLGWQPIAGDRITFETIFTLVLPPHAKGVPDLDQSEMRDPFDKMVPRGKPIDEELGRKLTDWAKGSTPKTPAPTQADLEKAIGKKLTVVEGGEFFDLDDVRDVETAATDAELPTKDLQAALLKRGIADLAHVKKADKAKLLAWIAEKGKKGVQA